MLGRELPQQSQVKLIESPSRVPLLLDLVDSLVQRVEIVLSRNSPTFHGHVWINHGVRMLMLNQV